MTLAHIQRTLPAQHPHRQEVLGLIRVRRNAQRRGDFHTRVVVSNLLEYLFLCNDERCDGDFMEMIHDYIDKGK